MRYPMSFRDRFIRRYPVSIYFFLTFLISWGGMLLAIGGPAGIPAPPGEAEKMLLPAMIALFAGPSLSGLLMIGLARGRAGYRDLLSRMTRGRVPLRWYAAALLTAPVIFTLVSFALSLADAAFLPALVTAPDKLALVIFGLSYGLIGGGLLEELGWTGFAVPELRRRHGIAATALIVGAMWGAWHFLVILWMSDPAGEVPIAVMLPIQLFSWLPAYRILMVWAYDRTGASMLIAMLMHTCLAAGMLILEPATMAGMNLLTYILVFAGLLWIVALSVLRFSRAGKGSAFRAESAPAAPVSGLGYLLDSTELDNPFSVLYVAFT